MRPEDAAALGNAIVLADDEEFEAVLDRVAPLQTPPGAVCVRCGAECRTHRYGCICPTVEFELFKARPGEE